jgi:hypothetical protein
MWMGEQVRLGKGLFGLAGENFNPCEISVQ